MFRPVLLGSLLFGSALSATAQAQDFSLSSTSIAEGTPLTKAQVFSGFGCTGDNVSPQLSWSGAPKGTKSFAITAYDPDAPTGSGWWHWLAVDIPAATSSVESGASGTGKMPKGSVEISNDYGIAAFGGACPPPGQVHRYIFTVYALSTEKLELPKSPSDALVGYMIHANALGSAHITAVYTR